MKRWDAHTKAVDGVQERTVVGACVSAVSVLVMVAMVVSELVAFMSVDLISHMSVDSAGSQGSTSVYGSGRVASADAAASARVMIDLHMTFFHAPCDKLHLELESTKGDASVTPENGVVKRKPTPKELAVLAPTLDPPGPGGITQEVLEGACTLQGRMQVGKVGGNFHVTVSSGLNGGAAAMMGLSGGFGLSMASVVDLLSGNNAPNMTHVVHALSFGPPVKGFADPLVGVTNRVDGGVGQFQYMLKVIPTRYRPLRRRAVETNQYSLSEQFVKMDLMSVMRATGSPGIWFYYDFYPVLVEYEETKPSCFQFITSLCAIVGGTFAVSSVVDGFFYQSGRALKKLS